MCSQGFTSKRGLTSHQKTNKHLKKESYVNKQTEEEEEDTEDLIMVSHLKSAFKNQIENVLLTNNDKEFIHNFETYLDKFKPKLRKLLNKYISEKEETSLKVMLSLDLKLGRPLPRTDNVKEEEQEGNLKTKLTALFDTYSIPDLVDILISKLITEYEDMKVKGSGWVIKDISGLNLSVNKYNVLKSGSYIKSPLKFKRFLVNVQNKEPGNNYCFLYSIYSKHTSNSVNREKLCTYSKLSEIESRIGKKYNFSGISYPTPISQISTFLKNNLTVSINIFGLNENKTKIFPIRITDEEKEDHFDLLLITNNTTSHYCLITNFNAIIASQLSKNEHSIFVCKRCLASFPTSERLVDHKRYCCKETVEQAAQYSFPKPGNNLKFKKYNMTQSVDFVGFADFEVMLTPSPSNSNSSTKIIHEHCPIAFTYYIVGPNNVPFKEPISFVGLNAEVEFVKAIREDALNIEKLYKKYPNPPTLSPQEELAFHFATSCCICGKPFIPNDIRVVHHSHTTNEVFGAAHQSCNLQCPHPNFFPIFFHNLSRYDGHIVTLAFDTGKDRITVIPCTAEHYISFSLFLSESENSFSIRFLDTYRFLSSSLRNLVKSMPNNHLFHTKRSFPNHLQFKFAQEKNFFPYEFLDHESKLSLTSLPPASAFYSSLDKSNITDEEYKFAKEAWEAFNCKTLKDYLEIYCKIDVLLLADCFLSFRKECVKAYTIDPVYSYSLPGFTFEAFLKLSQVELELLTDPDIYLFFESSIRGGICNAVQRYSKANCYAVPGYDNLKPPNSILYLDANNLYGYAMSQKLPISNFKFEEDLSKFTLDYIKNIPKDGEMGFFFEVDLTYPSSLHKKHNSLPLCPEKMCPPNSKVKKLICSLYDKKNYVCHYRTLQFALEQGLNLEKIYRVVSFRQSNFLADYIKINTQFRQQATSDFSKSLFKLMNNACFGKFIENQRDRINFDLVTEEKRLEKLIKSPFFKKSIIFKEKLVGIHRYKKQQLLNRPIHVGSTILELARLHMYEFYYNSLPKIFDIPFKLLYMDTDSFILSIQSPDVIPYIRDNSEWFDCSDYPSSHPLHSLAHKKVPGKFKDEMPGAHIQEIICICPKAYSIVISSSDPVQDKKEIKKLKGVQNCIVKKEMTYLDYYRCLFEKTDLVKIQTLFRSDKHVIKTIQQAKLALTLADSKRDWQDDDIISNAWGY